MLDVASLRVDTPALDHVTFFGSAGSSLPPAPVDEAVRAYLDTEQAVGGYEAADHWADELDRVYGAAASLLRVRPDEVAFVGGGAGEAWWRAFTAIDLARGDRVLVSTAEYQANAFAVIAAQRQGIEVVRIPNGADGTIDLEVLAEEIARPRTRVVCLTHVAMANGGVQPAAEVGALVRDTEALFLLDAAQSLGQIDVDVDAIGADLVVGTGRKFLRGPRGTGLLVVRERVIDRLGPPIFVDGRSAEWTDEWSYEPMAGARRFEFGECSYAAKVGFGVAIAYADEVGMPAIEARIRLLADDLRSRLGAIGGVTVTDRGGVGSGIVTFVVDGVDALDVAARLRADDIVVNAPGARNSRFDFRDRGLDVVVRAGVHAFNTEDEVANLAEAVGRVAD